MHGPPPQFSDTRPQFSWTWLRDRRTRLRNRRAWLRDSRTRLRDRQKQFLDSRTWLRTALGALLLAIVSVAPVAGQTQTSPEALTGVSILVQAAAGAVVTLVIGGGLLLAVPEYTERTTDRIIDQPIETFIYGLGISIAGVVVMFLLAITIVGIVLVIPLVIVGAVIGQLGYLAAGRAVDDRWAVALLAAVVVAAVVGGVPILGGLAGVVLSSMGIGAWFLDYRDDGDSGRPAGPSGTDPTPAGGPGTTRDHADADSDDGDEWTAGFDDDTRD